MGSQAPVVRGCRWVDRPGAAQQYSSGSAVECRQDAPAWSLPPTAHTALEPCQQRCGNARLFKRTLQRSSTSSRKASIGQDSQPEAADGGGAVGAQLGQEAQARQVLLNAGALHACSHLPHLRRAHVWRSMAADSGSEAGG